MKLVGLLIVVWLLFSCADGHDSDYIPYRLKALDAHVYADGQDFYAGRVEASYLGRKEGLAACQANASYLAKSKGFREWSFVCCTVAGDSDCKTKVR